MSIDSDHSSNPLSKLPADDREHIKGLSIDQLLDFTAARAEEYRVRASALLEIRNSHLLISAVPAEVLADIFTFAWRRRESFTLAHVCRRWRAIIFSTPAFWAKAIAGDSFGPSIRSQHYITTAVALSRGHTISHLRILHLNGRYTSIMESLHLRIRSMHLYVTDDSQLSCLLRTLRSKASWPQLNALRIDCRPSSRRQHWKSDMSTIRLPSLRRLQLPAFLFEVFAVPSLVDVSIGWPGVDHDLIPHNVKRKITSIIKILQRCTDLERLQLNEWLQGAAFKTADEGDQPPVAHLPSLRDLDIGESVVGALQIISHLDAPPSSHLRTHLHIGGLPRYLQSPTTRIPIFYNTAALCTMLTIGVDGASTRASTGSETVIRCLSPTGAEMLRIEVDQFRLDTVTDSQYLAESLRPTTITHLILAQSIVVHALTYRNEKDPPEYSALVHALPNLQALEICGESASGIVRALALGPNADADYRQDNNPEARLLPDGTGGVPWPCPCPSLRNVSIGWMIKCDIAPYPHASEDDLRRGGCSHPAEVPAYLSRRLESYHVQLERTLALRAVLGARPVETLDLYHVALCAHDPYHDSWPEKGELGEGAQKVLERLVRPLRAHVDGQVTYKGAIHVGESYVSKHSEWRPIGWDWNLEGTTTPDE